MLKYTDKMLHNAHKIAFLMQQYPEKLLPEVTTLMAMPAIDINSAIWTAEEFGLIATPNKETHELKFLAEPKDGWVFGNEVDDLEDATLFCLTMLARQEMDLEEFFITTWIKGYPTFDTLVAVKHLLTTNRLVEYVLQDQRRDEKGNPMFDEDENTPLMDDYIFYSLPEHAANEWGRKQFKNDPNAKQ